MMVPYTYCVLRYVHDPAAGEAINVGVLFYAPDAGYVRFLCEARYSHLSKLFAGFHHDDYQRFLGWLEAAVERFQGAMAQSNLRLFDLNELPSDAGTLARKLVPDAGLSFQFGEASAGVTRQLAATAEAIFHRMVVAQRPPTRASERRDDQSVWHDYQSVLRRHAITRALHPHVVATKEFEIPFDHAFSNEKWHAVEPMSFDYLDTASIREKAMKWMGYGVALKESPEFSKLYLLLGAPGLESHKRDYERAKSWLSRMPIGPVLVEEHDAESFARELASYMREHGVLPAEEIETQSDETPAVVESPPEARVKA